MVFVFSSYNITASAVGSSCSLPPRGKPACKELQPSCTAGASSAFTGIKNSPNARITDKVRENNRIFFIFLPQYRNTGLVPAEKFVYNIADYIS